MSSQRGGLRAAEPSGTGDTLVRTLPSPALPAESGVPLSGDRACVVPASHRPPRRESRLRSAAQELSSAPPARSATASPRGAARAILRRDEAGAAVKQQRPALSRSSPYSLASPCRGPALRERRAEGEEEPQPKNRETPNVPHPPLSAGPRRRGGAMSWGTELWVSD